MQGEGVIEQPVATDSGEVCASCGRTIGRLEQPFIWGDNIVCFGCHRHLTNDREAQTAAQGDYVFLSDRKVKITSRRLAFGHASYDVDLVRFARMRRSPARRWLGWLVASAGIAIALCGLNRHLDESDQNLLTAGAIVVGLGLAWSLLVRPMFAIVITLGEAEHIAFRSRSRRYAHQVLAAVAQAIIERGQNPVTPAVERPFDR
jgi:hypothetical protein